MRLTDSQGRTIDVAQEAIDRLIAEHTRNQPPQRTAKVRVLVNGQDTEIQLSERVARAAVAAFDAAGRRPRSTPTATRPDDDDQDIHGDDTIESSADTLFMRNLDRFAREGATDPREAGRRAQMVDPDSYHLYRESVCGMRLPRVRQRRNRHLEMGID